VHLMNGNRAFPPVHPGWTDSFGVGCAHASQFLVLPRPLVGMVRREHRRHSVSVLLSGAGLKRSKDPALDGQRTIMRSFRLGVTQDRVSVGVDDDGRVRTMTGQGNAQSARVGGEGQPFAVAGESG
jgi:hypothetical protein